MESRGEDQSDSEENPGAGDIVRTCSTTLATAGVRTRERRQRIVNGTSRRGVTGRMTVST
jgi:hypothetical protein